MKIRANYRVDRRLHAVEIKTGTTAFLAELDTFREITAVDDSEVENRVGVVGLTPQEYKELKESAKDGLKRAKAKGK